MRYRQDNFHMPLFRALRASMAMPFAYANTAASERASALSVGCSNPVFGRREYFHVLRLFNALQAGKFPIPFSEPRAAMLRAAVGGRGRDLARSRFREFARRCGRRRRQPKIARPHPECTTSVHPRDLPGERATPSDRCRRRRARIAPHRSARA